MGSMGRCCGKLCEPFPAAGQVFPGGGGFPGCGGAGYPASAAQMGLPGGGWSVAAGQLLVEGVAGMPVGRLRP